MRTKVLFVFWISWKRRNQGGFSNIHWLVHKLHHILWEKRVDYGCVKWTKTLKAYKASLDSAPPIFFDSFDRIRCANPVICIRLGLKVVWKSTSPDIHVDLFY